MTLHAERITAGYGQTEVLRNLSLAASAGDVLALAGPNGVGKTTLLRALSRVLRPQQGTVLIHERDLWAMSTREAARRIGLVAQNETMEWPLTVEQVVALGRTAHRGWFLPLNQADRGAIERAMSQTGLTPLRERMVPTLSGGERQRVLIARALAQEPESLLLDEPTAHLDLRYQGRVLDLVYQLAHEQGMTVAVLGDDHPDLVGRGAGREELWLHPGRPCEHDQCPPVAEHVHIPRSERSERVGPFLVVEGPQVHCLSSDEEKRLFSG